ncbi:MAG: hypothetical protein KJ687_07800, partial [Proteobacteria bacterium]|nr:hypothetical protein [Pseudomonadota bacterium]
MTEPRSDGNPFDLTKASDFSDSEILNYWVDLSGPGVNSPGLLSVLKPKLVMPMLLLGGKGSGKTHLMRFCSAPVQSMRHGGSLSEAVTAEGYLGIYLRTDGLNTGRFKGKGQPDDAWSTIFSYSFELWLSLVLIATLRDFVKASGQAVDEAQLFSDIASLFDSAVSEKFNSFATFEDFLRNEQRNIDFTVNNSALTRRLDGIRILFSPGRLAFGIPAAATKAMPSLADALIVYLIDEIENFTEDQQKFLNTLIRYRSGNVSIKLGSRLYGIKTYDTLGSGEPIKIDAEYERVELDSLLREKSAGYEHLAKQLILKRLNKSRLRHDANSEDDIAGFFESIDRSKAFQEYAHKIVSGRDKKGIERPCIEKLRSVLVSEFTIANSDKIDAIISNVRRSDHPLLEKLNVFLLYKKWGRLDLMVFTSEDIAANTVCFLEGRKEECSAYAQSFDHFGSDMLAQLLRECGKKNIYAGLDVLVHLSQGIPRNLLGILKHIYRNALFSGERPFDGGVISIDSQTDGVRDGANWFWDDAQPDSNGAAVRAAIDSLAVFFREVRYSDRPSECDLCSFSVDLDVLSLSARKTIEMAENWSYLVRVKGGAKNKNSRKVDEKYQLSPMLAPRWGLSPQRGGTIELQVDLANA